MSVKKPRPNGRKKSTIGAIRSPKNNAVKIPSTLKKVLRDAFDFFGNSDGPAQKKEDFIFHMTDWASDLEKLAQLYRHPLFFEREVARDVIFGFLVHATGHLNAASHLLLGEVFDPFLKKNSKRSAFSN